LAVRLAVDKANSSQPPCSRGRDSLLLQPTTSRYVIHHHS